MRHDLILIRGLRGLLGILLLCILARLPCENTHLILRFDGAVMDVLEISFEVVESLPR